MRPWRLEILVFARNSLSETKHPKFAPLSGTASIVRSLFYTKVTPLPPSPGVQSNKICWSPTELRAECFISFGHATNWCTCNALFGVSIKRKVFVSFHGIIFVLVLNFPRRLGFKSVSFTRSRSVLTFLPPWAVALFTAIYFLVFLFWLFRWLQKIKHKNLKPAQN